MAKDLFHEAVKVALQKEGWEITDDPYVVEAFSTNYNVDLGAERLIGARREKELIAVEVKSFIGPSLLYDFHLALGQYLNYSRGIRKKEPRRTLFLAVPESAYLSFFTNPDAQDAILDFSINLFSYNDLTESIVKWMPQNNSEL
ncbi:element excision factor XisH family protein [Persicitalea sp.]|uniref:element excision factor XisH family protein n=1 Tax=Persicitalea sp. TaxID=3100273 RepID=UPI0035935F0D